MKNFLKTLLAVICGLIIVRLIGLFISFFMLGSIALLGSGSTDIPSEGVLKLDMSKIAVSDQATQTLSSERISIGLRKLINAIDYAAEDPGVDYIYLKTDGTSAGIAAVQEIRAALARFRSSGKAIVAYMENPTTGTYYLASVADKIYMGSYQGGTPVFNGISSQLTFLGDALDKIGIKVQLIRHGKYKSAGEMYIRSSASAENLYQNQVMVNSLWKSLAEEIAQSRGLELSDLNELIDNLQLCLPEDFVSAGLVDGLLSRQDLEKQLARLGMKEEYADLKFIPFAEYAQQKVKENFRSLQKIAVVYACGQVVDGVDLQNVDGDRFASILEEIYNDDRIEAVVLRVNSPGGSVVASEKIRQMLDMIAEEKVLVASYGDYAASGGYWISSGADVIFADATTLTGSIGVFGMVPDLSKLYEETLHIGVQSVKSHEHSDMFNLSRPLDKKELAYMQRSIESIYTRFVSLVAESRDMSVEQVDEIAQGRVWTGRDALEVGLVDYLGGLNEALGYAASQIGSDISSVRVVEYPQELTLMELISSSLGGMTNDYSVSAGWANFYKTWYENWQNGNMEMVFATMPYMPVIR